MSKYAAQIAARHAAGDTAPEAAAHVGVCPETVYRWARVTGQAFANRKVPPPRLNADAEARRRAAHAEMMARRRDDPINGWTWAQLMDAGHTAVESARMRGQTIAAAYQAERSMGRKFQRHHKCPKRNPVAGLTDAERVKFVRARSTYNVSRDVALDIIGRADLIPPKKAGLSVRERLNQIIRSDPELATLVAMKLHAERNAENQP